MDPRVQLVPRPVLRVVGGVERNPVAVAETFGEVDTGWFRHLPLFLRLIGRCKNHRPWPSSEACFPPAGRALCPTVPVAPASAAEAARAASSGISAAFASSIAEPHVSARVRLIPGRGQRTPVGVREDGVSGNQAREYALDVLSVEAELNSAIDRHMGNVHVLLQECVSSPPRSPVMGHCRAIGCGSVRKQFGATSPSSSPSLPLLDFVDEFGKQTASVHYTFWPASAGRSYLRSPAKEPRPSSRSWTSGSGTVPPGSFPKVPPPLRPCRPLAAVEAAPHQHPCRPNPFGRPLPAHPSPNGVRVFIE